MSKISTSVAIALLLFISGCGIYTQSPQVVKQNKTAPSDFSMNTLKFSSFAFTHNSVIPSRYTCDGEDINPPLQIESVPEGAKSLAIIVNDPDSPSGDFVHWVVWNILPGIREIAENTVPEGAMEGMTDFGKTGFGGPCPHSGEHRYYFKLYALDTTLEMPASTRKDELEAAMRGHILDSAVLIGLYTRARE